MMHKQMEAIKNGSHLLRALAVSEMMNMFLRLNVHLIAGFVMYITWCKDYFNLCSVFRVRDTGSVPKPSELPM